MFEVLLESGIGFGDEPLIEFGLADARLVAGHEENPAPLWIECKSNTPNTAIRPETKFLHIGEGRTFQRVRVRPPQCRSALPQRHEQGKQGVLDLRYKIIELRFASGMKSDIPRHSALCAQAHNAVKRIFLRSVSAARISKHSRHLPGACRDSALNQTSDRAQRAPWTGRGDGRTGPAEATPRPRRRGDKAVGPAGVRTAWADLGAPIYDYLPEPHLESVYNLYELAGVLAVGKSPCQRERRQAVFFRARVCAPFFIWWGFVFNAGGWNFPDSPCRGAYPRSAVYQSVSGWDAFDPWPPRIERFPEAELRATMAAAPPSDLARLQDATLDRRTKVCELIE